MIQVSLKFEPEISEQLSSSWSLGWVKLKAANNKGGCRVQIGLTQHVVLYKQIMPNNSTNDLVS